MQFGIGTRPWGVGPRHARWWCRPPDTRTGQRPIDLEASALVAAATQTAARCTRHTMGAPAPIYNLSDSPCSSAWYTPPGKTRPRAGRTGVRYVIVSSHDTLPARRPSALKVEIPRRRRQAVSRTSPSRAAGSSQRVLLLSHLNPPWGHDRRQQLSFARLTSCSVLLAQSYA